MCVLFQKHGMNTRTGWCWQMFMKKATVRITVQDRHGSAGLIGRKWYFPQMSRVFSFGLKQALWMQIGPQMLLPSRFGSPQLPAAAHLASVHSPDQQRRAHNRHFRPWTRRNTSGGWWGWGGTSAPSVYRCPLCDDHSRRWSRWQAVCGSLPKFYSLCYQQAAKSLKKGRFIQNWQRFRLKL